MDRANCNIRERPPLIVNMNVMFTYYISVPDNARLTVRQN